MPLQVNTFATYVTNFATALANNTAKITNLRSGSVAYAIARAVAGNAIALQRIMVNLFAVCRLSTSTGPDVDSFVADFGMTRLSATYATGYVTLTRNLTNTELDIALTGILQTPINGIQFSPVADTTQASYDPVRQLYVFSPTVGSITVKVQALVAGAGGNVAQNALTQIVSGFTGVNSVTNASGFYTGSDSETDAALKARFVTFLASLKKANLASIAAAIVGVQPNVSYSIVEYLKFDGTAFPAGFTVVVDDGSGNAQAPFVNAVSAAVNNARAAGIQYAVTTPTDVPINIFVVIAVGPGASLAVAQANVVTALSNYINTLGVGVTAGFVNISNVIQDTTGVFSYSGLLLNGGASDVVITNTQLARLGSVTF